MTLTSHLLTRIAALGPLNIAEYMAECLFHPTLGYYTTREPFGVTGDFVTAPETSQMFGELIGLCLAQCWMEQGQTPNFALVELGPGRGTLMADILRATAKVPGFHQAAEVTLIEASPRLRQVQEQTLASYKPRFLDTVDALPPGPVFFVANEFFDALPIRQFQRSGTGWRERQVGQQNDKLVLGLGPQQPQPALTDRLEDTKEGDVVEYAPALAPIISTLGQAVSDHGGAGLVIDYGDWRSLGDTLQAVQQHAFKPVLHAPGTCDLTAHVDFESLCIAAGCRHTRLTPQGIFLERLGITERAQALAAHLSGVALDNHIQAHRRLTHPEEMGNLFKVIGFYPEGSAPPAGLDA